jgi:hypothetical protein
MFKHIPMQWMAIWMYPKTIKAMEVGKNYQFWVTTGYKLHMYDMVVT